MGLERSLINPYILTRLAIKKILVSKIGQNVPNFNFRSIFVFPLRARYCEVPVDVWSQLAVSNILGSMNTSHVENANTLDSWIITVVYV